MNALQTLQQWTTVVADTANLQALAQHRPQEATTNPSLILQAAGQADNARLIHSTLAQHAGARADQQTDAVLVAFAQAILALIPGRVSIEVDARLSFDTPALVQRAQQILALAQAAGVDTGRILIKLAATWEGIQAARVLEGQGHPCNLTLVFSLVQAQACAQAKVRLISPFVGRVGDWYQKNQRPWPTEGHPQDPGVALVRSIFHAYKTQGVSTQIMGASFRSTAQVLALSGCDLLTLSPALLAELQTLGFSHPPAAPALAASAAHQEVKEFKALTEANFRQALNEDAMATEKLAEGIRWFARDARALEALLQTMAKPA